MADSEKYDAAETNETVPKSETVETSGVEKEADTPSSRATARRSAMKDAADAWYDLGKTVTDEFRAGTKEATSRAIDYATEVAERASESTRGASTRFNDAAVRAVNAAGDVMDKTYDAASEAADKAYAAASDIADDAAEMAGKTADDLRDATEDFVEHANETASQAANAAAKVSADLLEQAQKDATEWQDKFMRLHAEWDTYRRRTNEDRVIERERANEKLMEDLLPVLDDFERTIAYANENGVDNLLGGVEAVQTKLINVLQADGLEAIDPQGQAFDSLEHQAVGTVENTEAPDETVAQVYQKGYKMGGKVIRPAMVQVTTGGPQREKEDGEDE